MGSTRGIIGQDVAGVVRHGGGGVNFLEQFIERFFLVRQLHVGLIRLGFGGRRCLIHARLLERLEIDAADFEGGGLLGRFHDRGERLEAGAIKINAESGVQKEGDEQADEEPVPLFAAGPNGVVVEIGCGRGSHGGRKNTPAPGRVCQTDPRCRGRARPSDSTRAFSFALVGNCWVHEHARVALNLEQAHETKPRGFSTTRWSLIIQGAKLEPEEAKACTALAELCHIYWRPVFSFVCRRDHSPEDAQDLTQEFFAHILQHELVAPRGSAAGPFSGVPPAARSKISCAMRRTRIRRTNAGAGRNLFPGMNGKRRRRPS